MADKLALVVFDEDVPVFLAVDEDFFVAGSVVKTQFIVAMRVGVASGLDGASGLVGGRS